MSAPVVLFADRRLEEIQASDTSAPEGGATGTTGSTPLTDALIDIASQGLSFATPGHRGGRSCRSARRR